MKARFQPKSHCSPSAGIVAVEHEIRQLPQRPSKIIAELLSSFEHKSSLETSVFGRSAAGTGLMRLVIRNQTLPGNILRIGIFAGLEASGLEVVPQLSNYLASTLKRRKKLRAEIRTYPLSYPSAWFPSTTPSPPSLLPELWSGSMLSDAYYLEREIAVYRFNLVISLHLSQDDTIRLETSSQVIRNDLLAPVRESVLKKFPQETAQFIQPALRHSASPQLLSPQEVGGSFLEIALYLPRNGNPLLTAKILEELELQYPPMLAYQAYI